jgi:hypothetical protein
MQLAAEGVVIAVCSMVRLGVGVRGRTHMLKIRFCQGRFIGRQSMPTCPAAAEQNDGDKRRENGPGKVTTFSVGQGETPMNLLTVIHRRSKTFFERNFGHRYWGCAPQARAIETGKNDEIRMNNTSYRQSAGPLPIRRSFVIRHSCFVILFIRVICGLYGLRI